MGIAEFHHDTESKKTSRWSQNTDLLASRIFYTVRWPHLWNKAGQQNKRAEQVGRVPCMRFNAKF